MFFASPLQPILSSFAPLRPERSAGLHHPADKVRPDELAGILERSKGTGWILQEPGSSCV
jgi:hypothetical protein